MIFFNICYVPVTVLVLCVYYVAVVWLLSLTQLCEGMYCSLPGSSACGDSPGKNTGVGSHALLERIFPTQGLNLGLLNCRQILYQLSHQGCLISYVCKYITFLITLWDERLATLFQAHRIIGVPRATLRGLVLLSLASTCMQTLLLPTHQAWRGVPLERALRMTHRGQPTSSSRCCRERKNQTHQTQI